MSTTTVVQQTPSNMHGNPPYISVQKHIVNQKEAQRSSVGKKERNNDEAHLIGSLRRLGRSFGRYCKALISGIYGFAWGLEGGFKEHGKRRALSGAVAGIVAAIAYNKYQAALPIESMSIIREPESELKIKAEGGTGSGAVKQAESNVEQQEFELKRGTELTGEFGQFIAPAAAVAAVEHVQGREDNEGNEPEPLWSESSKQRREGTTIEVYAARGIKEWEECYYQARWPKLSVDRQRQANRLKKLAQQADMRKETEKRQEVLLQQSRAAKRSRTPGSTSRAENMQQMNTSRRYRTREQTLGESISDAFMSKAISLVNNLGEMLDGRVGSGQSDTGDNGGAHV